MFGRRRGGSPRLPVWPVLLWVASSAGLVVFMQAPPGVAAAGYGLAFTTAQVAVVVTVGVAAFRRGGDRRERRPWRLLFAGFLLTLLGNTLFAASQAGPMDGQPNLPLTVGGVVVGAAAAVPTMLGLFAFPVRPTSPRERGQFWLDMLTVLGGGVMVLWYLLIGPALERSKGAYELLSMVPPIPQGALLFAVSAIVMRTAVRSVRHPVSVLLLGLAIQMVGDLIMTYLVMTSGRMAPNLPLGVVLLAGEYVVVVAAALQIRTTRTGVAPAAGVTGPHQPSRLPYFALALGYGLLIVAACRSKPYPWAGLVAGAVMMTAAVAIRQMLAIRDNRQQVLRDSLTGLSSRVHVHNALIRAVQRGHRDGRAVGVLLIDLDDFKEINDSFGHAAGDDLLIHFAETLRRSLRATDTAGRLGGDEFVVVLPDITDVGSAVTVARKILTHCRQPVTVAGEHHRISASIGIAVATAADPVTADDLLRQADTAMYVAKRRAGHMYEVYRDGLVDTAAPAGGGRAPAGHPASRRAAPRNGPALTPTEREELEHLRALLAEVEHRAAAVHRTTADHTAR